MNPKYISTLSMKHSQYEDRQEYIAGRQASDVQDFLCGLDPDTIDTAEATGKLTDREDLHTLILAAIQGNAGPLERAYSEIAKSVWSLEILEQELADDGY